MAFTKQRQQKHLKSIGKSMLRHLQSYFETGDPEELRRFRVQVKKMKALLALVQQDVERTNFSQKFQPIRSVYQQAGEIRSGHLHVVLLDSYHLADPAFKQSLLNTIIGETDKFNTQRKDHFKLVRKQLKHAAGTLKELSVRVVFHWFIKQLKRLARFFAKESWKPEKLHKSRIKIKNLLYLYPMLPQSLIRKLSLKEAYLDQLQEILGAWHDVNSSLEWLKMQGLAKGAGLIKLQQEEERLLHSIRENTRDFAQKVVFKAT